MFNDLTFLNDSVRARHEGDLVKAVRVLALQMEFNLHSMVGKPGKFVTKPHRAIADIGVALNIGDILYSSDLTELLGSQSYAVFSLPLCRPTRNESAEPRRSRHVEARIDRRKCGSVTDLYTAHARRLEGINQTQTLK